MTIFEYTIKKVINYIIIFFLLVVGLLIGSSNNALLVHADEVISTSGVMEDLEKDLLFDKTKYPVMVYEQLEALKKDDIESNDIELLNVIQIAESRNRELAIYVYEPTQHIKEINALKINIATDPSEKNYDVYDLTLIDREGVFSKYLVDDFIVNGNDLVRYYDISNIYREYDVSLDKEPLESNTISYVGIPVGKVFSAYTNGNTIQYSMEYTEWIKIDISYYGSIKYYQSEGYLDHSLNKELFDSLGVPSLSSGTLAKDSHYVCFNTNRQMDDLLEAEIYFETTELGTSYSYIGQDWEKHPTENKIIVKKFDNFTINGGIFHDDYTLERVEKATDFLKDEYKVLNDKAKENIQAVIDNSSNTAWCLRYCETDYLSYVYGDSSSGGSGIYGVKVDNATILRLKFVTDGITYNLGVVDNMTSSDNIADGSHGNLIDDKQMTEWFEKILMLIGIILLCTILNFVTPIFSIVFNVLGKCLKWILKGVILVITAPFKLIGSLFKNRR